MRKLAVLNLLVIVALVLVACKGPTTTVAPTPTTAPTVAAGAIKAEEATPTPVAAEVSKYNEAPMLAELVQAGKLPPVA